MIYLATGLAWVVNWPHFSATSYRLFQDPAHVRQFKLTSFLIPAVVTLGAIASFAFPDGFAPYFVKFYMIWSPYHFSGQTLGITLIYARRANFQIQKWERLALFWFIFGTFFYQSSMAETYGSNSDFYGVSYPGLGIPFWVPTLCKWVMYAAGACFVGLAIKQGKAQNRIIPLIVFLPPIAQYIWFVHASGTSSFQEFVPFFHSLQYLLIAWNMEMHFQAAKEKTIPSASQFFLTKSATWGMANFIGGACLFYFLPLAFVKFGWSYGFATAIVLSSVQLHHFFVDGVIWKLKSKTNISPLMANISDIFTVSPGKARS